MPSKHFEKTAINHAGDEMWNDPFRVVGRRYYTQDDALRRWYQVTAQEFNDAVIYYLLDHTQEDQSAHPRFHYTIAVAQVRSQLAARTRLSSFTPPDRP